MGLGKRLMRAGTPEADLGPQLLASVGRIRTDSVRVCAGREVQSRVKMEGSSVVVTFLGRDAMLVARHLARRVLAPLRAVIEDVGRGEAQLRITEGP